MKTIGLSIVVAAAAALGGCAAVAPRELVSAREAYQRASTGSAAQEAPAELNTASQALARAEESFVAHSDTYQTRDLAYVARRRSEMAEVKASITSDRRSGAQATDDYQVTQREIVARTREDLDEARAALAASQASGVVATAQLSAERKQRGAAERRAADAQSALADLAAVKTDPRGTVITLSDTVLFSSDDATLLPVARSRLDKVAEVLLSTSERNLTVEGHTDSVGPRDYNLDLSLRRANAVRDYLVQREYQADKIQAYGLGAGYPIGDNSTLQGRVSNRRVEIVIEADPSETGKLGRMQAEGE